MLAPSEHSEEAAVAAAPAISTTTEQVVGDTSGSCQENNKILDLCEIKEEIEKVEELKIELELSDCEKVKESNTENDVVKEEKEVERESPEIPQKVAFTENECSGEEKVELCNGKSGEGQLLDLDLGEEVMEGKLISLDMGETKELVMGCVDVNNNNNAKVEVVEVIEKKSGEGDVLEILNKLESLKTPEPHEVDSGIVRASFVDFTMDDEQEQLPVEEQSDDDDEADEDTDEAKEGESVEIFQVGDMAASNPELQKIREEQVRKWLKFEEENPMTEKMNGVIISEEEGMGEGEDGEMMTVNGEDGMPRRVRFLTDTEGNLLISVFMSKLVHLFLFFLKVASGGYLDLHSFTSTSTSSVQQRLPTISSHQRNQSLSAPAPAPETAIASSCIIDIETDGNESRLRLNVNESHFSTPTAEPTSEEGSLASTNGNHEAPALVVSPPSLDPQINGDEQQPPIVPTAPPMENDSDDDEPEPPSIVLVEPLVPKEPPKEKPPAPPIDDIDEGCNSSDETLSVSSCNSMIEIMPQNQNAKFELEQNTADSSDSGGDGIEEMDSLNFTSAPDMQTQIISEGNGNVEPDVAPTPVFHIDKPEENGHAEDAGSDGSSQPASFIIHDLEENENVAPRNETSPIEPTDDVIKLPTIDENNNVVEDDVENAEEENRPEAPESELKPDINTQVQEEEEDAHMPDLRLSHCSSSSQSDGEEERFISALSEMPSVRDHQTLENGITNGTEEEQEEQLMSLRIQEEHISSVALSIAKWESMVKAQSTENLATSPVHPPLSKCSSSPCPKLVKSLATAIEQVNPVPVVPLNPFPVCNATQQNGNKSCSPALEDSNNNYDSQHNNNNNNRDECNNNNNSNSKAVSVNNALNTANHNPSSEPIVVTKAPGWNCWGNKIKDPKPLVDPSGPIDSDEIIYAQPNHQAGSTMTSIANPSAILKQYPKPISKGEIIMWLKEGEIHRAGLLLNYGQSHHHAPVLATPHNMSPVLVSWFFGLISRHQAEKYLHGQPPGTFLVRISTRIWGYTLSYQATNGRTKHFLISAINPAVPATLQANPEANLPPQTGKQQRMSPFMPQGRYAFIGTNMTPYGTLVSLIRHHSHAPITKLGGEKLLNPCPGGPQVAGLENLFK